jgi:hypothetical protein
LLAGNFGAKVFALRVYRNGFAVIFRGLPVNGRNEAARGWDIPAYPGPCIEKKHNFKCLTPKKNAPPLL